MAKSLIIVESPAKAKTLSKYLGKNYKIEASMGHIKDLPKSQLGIDIESGFMPKYITIRGKGPLLNNLKKEAAKADKILLATDPDREGEAISWHLANALDIPESEPCRIEFYEITKNAVLESLKHPRTINTDLVEAQQARRILDRLVGYKISPILWRKVKWGLSAGRVQSVAVRIICDREKEIKEFIPDEYWTIDADLKGDKDKIRARLHSKNNKKIKIENKEQADMILEEIKNKTFEVAEIKTSERRKMPPLTFTTSSMQQEAARKLGFTAKKTMMIAQQLYEGLDIKGEGAVGLITYMRTDSTRVSEQAKKEAAEYIEHNYGKEYLGSGYTARKNNKKNVQDAHEGIRPTSVLRTPEKVKDSLTRDQYKLYKLIWDRFVSSQMAAAVYDTVSVSIRAGEYIFKVSGSTVKFPGFMLLYTEGSDEDSEKDDSKIPQLKEGQVLKLLKLIPEQHFTQPPPRYTEAMLVKVLEEKGIGRPSTYAPTIDVIQKRGYVEKEKGRFKPTELGEIVVQILQEFFSDIVDIDFTAEMEEKLDKIESGHQKRQELLESFYTSFEKKLKIAEQELKKVKIEDEVSDEKCEFCGRNMVIKNGRYGKFLACPGFPECKNTKPIITEIGVKCPQCGGNLIVRKSKRGRTFYGCSNYPNCKFVSWNKPSDEPCPKCGALMVIKKTKNGEHKVCTNKECGYDSK
ncbi:MAG: type I DNA topoisomerase [Tepidanaerobacter acetatoxydans]|uniref:type I DNA topoisomerase n=1 Tax=Tepidanaerobacter acetatoxydans TaxID=499229 RepID=UPI0026F34F75|nr:type I DNA topoisomerase [Tepidanaerobacter acetatoxydans]NLU10922.1 type I DNA topoisomerase [Tepidanaerobacter acetatoxydans]